jgi:Resolvase, N terminal domain
LKATEQPIDTGTAAGKYFLDMLGVFAEFETNLRRERQLEGIAKAKAAGVYKGRPATIDASRKPSRSAGRLFIGCWKPADPRAYHRPTDGGTVGILDPAPAERDGSTRGRSSISRRRSSPRLQPDRQHDGSNQ